jgi:thioredoxin-related protein
LILVRNTEQIESIAFFNLGQKIYLDSIPFSDSIHLEFPVIGDDIFNIHYIGNGTKFKNQIWLGVKAAKIYVSIVDKKLSIDKVVGDTIYQQSIKFVQERRAYKGAEDADLSAFLLLKIEEHINSPFSLLFADYFIDKLQNNKAEMRKLQKIMESQPEVVKNHMIRSRIYERTVAISTIDTLNFQSYSFINRDLEQARIVDPNDEYIVLDFWFVNCPPCVKQHQEIKKDFEAGLFKGKLRMIGISIDKDIENWNKYLTDHDINWENYVENYIQKDKLSNQLSIKACPTYCLLDKSQAILKYFYSYQELKQYLGM